MDAASLPDPAGEPARILHVLRHALADPLSAAALKLDLVERRLLSPSGADPSWAAERVRAVQADLAATTRLLDLLLRLAAIAGERPEEKASLRDVCLRAAVPLDSAATAPSRLPLRATALAEAIRSVAVFVAGPGATAAASGREGLESGRVTLTLEGSRERADAARLLDLPHGSEDAAALFVARAAVAADGGRLELTEREGRLSALFSWPLRAEGDAGPRGDA
ncbi:MAG: hypothetical protein ABI768_13050 [Acidobacteriota bacterium]